MNKPRVHSNSPLPSYYTPLYELPASPFSRFFVCASIDSKKADLKRISTAPITIVSVTSYVPSVPILPPPLQPPSKKKSVFNFFGRSRSSQQQGPAVPAYKELLQPLSGKYRDAILPSNFQYSKSIYDGLEYRCRNIGSDGWEKVVKGMLLTGSKEISHHSTHTPFFQLQEILHSSHASITLTAAGKEKGLPVINSFPIPTWIYNSTRGSLRADVSAALLVAVAKKVKELHQSKYAHRNINSETVWISIAFHPTSKTEEDIIVDLRGEEICEDLVKATSNSDQQAGLGTGVFRHQTSDLGYTGPRWLRCLSSEVADSDTTTTTDLEDDPTVERIRSGATRGYICPETIRSCSGSSSVGSSSGKSVSKKSTAEDAFAMGALLRDVCTGVPPHVTVDAFKKKWTARLATPAFRVEAEKVLLGITDLASVDFDCLKLMRGLLNSDKNKRLSVSDILVSPFITKRLAPGEKETAPIVISKPTSGQEELEGVPGYIKDEFNTLMDSTIDGTPPVKIMGDEITKACSDENENENENENEVGEAIQFVLSAEIDGGEVEEAKGEKV
ncbi:hypothetical protein TrLO_g7170 [Triparma laevis f. longispina]|uniref:Protein kinase domain-containing protein n=1 Tax=Triparma laevis f. longispina TaxID=1714387 RepID=A0A9W7KWS6_9STRA|nr:hypothetical protein TrLO_g7170 [Triparma laevis f. longispina]